MRLVSKLSLICFLYSSILSAADFRFVKTDFPGATLTTANGINARGDIVGRYDDVNGVTHGFLLRGNGFSTVDFPGAFLTAPRAINARGDIVGRMQFADGVDHAFLLIDGKFSQIDYPGASATVGRGINNAGDVTGNYSDTTGNEIAFLLQDGKYYSISADPCSSDVWSSLDNGRVLVGDNCSNPDNSLHGFVRDEHGIFHSIDYPGTKGRCTAIRWINERREIVGLFAYVRTTDECYQAGTISYHGFLLRLGMYSAIDVPGASSTQVWAISDDGQIVGQYRDATGSVHGFKAALRNEN
jgi:probable HAF family extracellular repeat protein